MIRSSGATIACAASGSRASINWVEPFRSANSTVTIFRSPSRLSAAGASATRFDEASDCCAAVVDASVPNAVPQSSQNVDKGAFCAPHVEQGLDNGLPQTAQNFRPVVLSVPHLTHRIAPPPQGERRLIETAP